MTKKADSFIVTVDNEENINVIDSIELNKYRVNTADKAQVDPKTGSKQVPQESFLHGKQVLDPKYNPMDLIEILDLYSYHEACVDAVATDVSGIGYTLDPIEGESGNEKEKEKFKLALDNSTPSINVHLYRTIYDRRAIGYGACEIIRYGTSKSDIKRFKHIPAHTLHRHTDLKRVLHMSGDGKQVWYVIYGKNYDENGVMCDVHADTGEFYPYNTLSPEERANELLWTIEYAPGTNYYGRPPIIASLPSIQGDLSAVAYNTQFFKNYGMPAFAVTVTGDFQDYNEPKTIRDKDGNTIANPKYDETQTLRYKITEQIKQVIKNPHSAICITVPTASEDAHVEIKITPLSVKTEEGHFRMYRKDVRDEVIHGHKVDPSRLAIFDTGNLNGTNSDNTKASYKYGVIAPIKSEIEAMINQTGNELGCTNWRFRINDVDPINYKNDIELADFLFARGAMTIMDLINNFGDKFGLNVENTEDKYLNARYLNGVPLEQVWNQSEQNPYNELDSILGRVENGLNGDDASDVTETGKFSEEGIASSTN